MRQLPSGSCSVRELIAACTTVPSPACAGSLLRLTLSTYLHSLLPSSPLPLASQTQPPPLALALDGLKSTSATSPACKTPGTTTATLPASWRAHGQVGVVSRPWRAHENTGTRAPSTRRVGGARESPEVARAQRSIRGRQREDRVRARVRCPDRRPESPECVAVAGCS